MVTTARNTGMLRSSGEELSTYAGERRSQHSLVSSVIGDPRGVWGIRTPLSLDAGF